jgi:diketogulonate reductase-like aldo/keto reductase
MESYDKMKSDAIESISKEVSLSIEERREAKAPNIMAADPHSSIISNMPLSLASFPSFGLGTYKLKGELCVSIVSSALEIGYRLIDTARCYRNEAEIGTAIKRVNIARSSLFITTKIPPTEQGYEEAYNALLSSLETLQTSYIDLVLIHWPGKSKTPLSSPDNKLARLQTWRALKRAQREGLVRFIGVSNFTVRQLEELISEMKNEIIPEDLNYENWKPFLNQVAIKSRRIQVFLFLYIY